ncbi:peptidase E [Puia sp.]|jgi:peptidase E|uniref:Type 1 glutamine amidotransferase-like domain-containing protein n=1 Tax=Puia sp. TaxID=2045100 RepID=UPI002F4226D3
MKKTPLLAITCILLGTILYAQPNAASAQATAQPPAQRTILAYGGALQKGFIKQVAILTGKPHPKICFLPTASADNPNSSLNFYGLCRDLPIEPWTLSIWVNSNPSQQTFEQYLMSMDAIIIGGGNTLNMIALWKGQGIDTVLRKAYDKGIILAGGSAGSLCWFTGGYSDSRPQNLSIINGLAFLPYSHCPHYHSELGRKPLYTAAILDGKLGPGYACDDRAAILFRNEHVVKTIALDNTSHCYYLSVKEGKISEEQLPTEVVE